jgi:predicted metal-dependent enzyme (double-stranded beta helix superfamily)
LGVVVVFDLGALVEECVQAGAEGDPRRAVRDVLARAVSRPGALAEAMGEPAGGLQVLHNGPDLTVVTVVWPPRMSLFPHDHRMWAAIAIYAGREDNAFYRRHDGRLAASGGKTLEVGDVLLLGDDAIHAVANPTAAYTGAIHVYGGDFVATPRSQWDPETLSEEPYDLDTVRREFDRAEDAARALRG